MVLARAATKTGPSCSEFLQAVFPARGAVGADLGNHVRSPARKISTETAVCWPGKLRKPASPAKVLLRNSPQSGITPYRYPRQGSQRTVTILCQAPSSRSNPPARSPFGKPFPVSLAHKSILSSYYVSVQRYYLHIIHILLSYFVMIVERKPPPSLTRWRVC